MRTVEISTEFIKLGQLLKLATIVGQGSDARMLIENGEIFVNGEVETQRGKKIKNGDVVQFEDEKVKVISTFEG